MNVKILGSGCMKCAKLEQQVRDVVKNNNLNVSVEKVTDLNEIMKYSVMMTPGIVVDEKVVSAGKMPKDSEILNWLKG